jgi:hypothetical protein
MARAVAGKPRDLTSLANSVLQRGPRAPQAHQRITVVRRAGEGMGVHFHGEPAGLLDVPGPGVIAIVVNGLALGGQY